MSTDDRSATVATEPDYTPEQQIADLEASLSAAHDLISEVARELDRALAPADQSLPNRVRQLARTHVQKQEETAQHYAEALVQAASARRRRLPDEREGFTKKFKLPYAKDGGTRIVKGYITCNTFPDGTPGELFIVVDQTGTSARGYLDAYATAVSIGLQYGVPLEVFASKAIGTKFGPAGSTGEGEEGVAIASSVLDYVFRTLQRKFSSQRA